MDKWKEHNVFGGPTFWEEYEKDWTREFHKASNDVLLARRIGRVPLQLLLE